MYCVCVGGYYQNINNKRYHNGGVSPAAVSTQYFFKIEDVGGKEMVQRSQICTFSLGFLNLFPFWK